MYMFISTSYKMYLCPFRCLTQQNNGNALKAVSEQGGTFQIVQGRSMENLQQAPPNCGSDCFNYKKSNSSILLAVVDHDYCFTYIDVGAKGRASDGGVWENNSLVRAFEKKGLNIPPNGIIVGDDAFPLKTSFEAIQQKKFNN